MLAVGGTSCISLVSVAAADENSLTPLHRLLPTETASRGFGGSPVGGGDKSSRFAFSAFPCGGGITTLWPLCLCRNNPARGLFQQKKRLSQSGCSAPTDTLFPPAHSAFSAFLHGGGITIPSACVSCCRNAGRPRVTAAYSPFLCRCGARPVRAEYPLAGYTRHPIPQTRTQRLTRRNTAGYQGRW